MTRSNNIILPDESELSEILKAEVRRSVPVAKENVHYPEFGTAIALFQSYDLPTELFTDDSLTVYQAVANGSLLLEEAVRKILSSPPTVEQWGYLDAAYDYLSEEDDLGKSDLIFVFGSKTPLRAEKAVEVFKHGFADKVMISGGYPIYADKTGPTEAEKYKQIMMDNGVPGDAVMTENQAITLPDNVWRTINYLEENQVKYTSMILVNSPYAQRRGWSLFKKHLPDSVKLYRVNSDCLDKFKKENWYKQEDTLRVVLNEFIKMRASVVYNTA